MANPFDQFDAPAANPFDQFDAPASGEGMPSTRKASSEGRSRGGFRKQVEEAFTNPAETPRIPTAAELAGRYGAMGRGALEGIPSAIAGLPGDIVGIVADNPYTSHEIANAMFGETTSADQARGRLFGGALTSFASPAAAAKIVGPLKEAARAAELTNTARALGATQTVLDPITAALQGGGAVVQKGVDIANKLSPAQRTMTQAVGTDAERIVNALRAPGAAYVPGTQPTVGEIAAGAGIGNTQLAALQTKLAKDPALASQFAAREAANELARVKSIGTIAPEIPADLAAAEKARATQAAADYSKVEKKLVSADETLTTLLETPAMKSAISVAEDIAANKGRTFKIGENVPAREVPSTLVDPTTGKPFVRQMPAQTAEYTGQSLLDIKAGLDKMLETKVNAAGSALGNKEIAAISGVRQQYMSWLENALPGVKTARTEFAARSKPINAMEVGQVLKQALTNPLDEGVTRPGVFAQAVRNAPGTIKKATGAPRFEDLSAVLETADSAKVANVLSDFARSAEFKRLSQATTGAKTGESIADIPGARGVIGTLASGIMKAFENAISRKAAIQIGEAMLQPETFARLVEKYAIPNAPRNIMERNARRLAMQERNVRRNNLLRGGVQTSNALAPQEAP